MFPNRGKVIRGGYDPEHGKAKYASMIATALRSDLGTSHRATKTLMKWTGASERAAKHWLSGLHGPGGAHLIVLMRESDAVFESILAAAGRRDAVLAARVLAAGETMVDAMTILRRERADPARVNCLGLDPDEPNFTKGSDDLVSDRMNDPVNPTMVDGLNLRQWWFLEALASGLDVRAGSLQRRWRVSVKTARRDLATLSARGLIEFIGSFKTGKYRRLG